MRALASLLLLLVFGLTHASALPDLLEACPVAPPANRAAQFTTFEEFRARIETSRRRYEVFACQARLGVARRAVVLMHIKGSSGSLEDFVADATLQNGDVVVTDKGFRVFKGGDAPAERNFVPISDGWGKPRLRRTLNDMEKASGFRDSAPRP